MVWIVGMTHETPWMMALSCVAASQSAKARSVESMLTPMRNDAAATGTAAPKEASWAYEGARSSATPEQIL